MVGASRRTPPLRAFRKPTRCSWSGCLWLRAVIEFRENQQFRRAIWRAATRDGRAAWLQSSRPDWTVAMGGARLWAQAGVVCEPTPEVRAALDAVPHYQPLTELDWQFNQERQTAIASLLQRHGKVGRGHDGSHRQGEAGDCSGSGGFGEGSRTVAEWHTHSSLCRSYG